MRTRTRWTVQRKAGLANSSEAVGARTTRLWKGWIAFGCLGLGIYLVGPGEWARYIYSSYALTAAGVGIISMRLSPLRPHSKWYWLPAWLIAWGLGDIAYNFSLGADWTVTPPQILYVLGYGLAFVFVVSLYRHSQPRGLGPLIDASTVVLALGWGVWSVAFHPRLEDGDLATVITSFSYPALDIFVFGMLIATVLTSRGRPLSQWLATLATGLLVAVDVPFFWFGYSETYVAHSPVDVLWLANYVLLGAAMMHPSLHELPQTRRRAKRGRGPLWLVAVAIMVPAVTSVISDSLDLGTTMIVASLISVLVLTRLQRATSDRDDALRETEQALAELERSEHSFRLLAENSQDLVFRVRVSPELAFAYVSPASNLILGYAPEDWYADPSLWERITEPGFADNLTEGEAPDGPFLVPCRHQDGHKVWIEVLLTPVLENGQWVAVEGRGRDVTNEVTTSQKLEILRAQSDAILDSVGQGILYTDASNRITFANRAAAELLGWDLEDLLGRDGHAAVHHSRPDGSPYPRQECPISRAASAGLGLESDQECFWRKDGTSFPVKLTVTPLVGDKGSGAVIVFSDSTEGREIEQRMRQTEKMEAFGQFAGGVAHDFNNLLSVVINYGSFLLEDLGKGDSRADDVREIIAAGERGAQLTRQLLTFSRKDDARPANISVNTIIADITKMLRRTMKESVNVCLDLEDDLSAVYLDPGQLEQVIINLAINANDAMPSGGELRIRTRKLSSNETPGVRDWVGIDISDSGTGIPANIRTRIFEPFFTTKDVDKGTGLGLATVYGIVEGAGGSISCKSELGIGTTFTVLLPESSDIDTPQAQGTWVPHSGEGQTILVVEDETPVLRTVTKLLERNGYETISFDDPRKALSFVRSAPFDGVAMLLTDIVMPGMSGVDLAAEVNLPVVYMTGYPTRSFDVAAYPETNNLLHKPFSEKELLHSIEETLGTLGISEAAL